MHAFNKSTDILKLEATQFTCICWQNTGLRVDVNPQTPFEGSEKRRGGNLNLLEVRVATLSGGALVGRRHPRSEDVHTGELLFLRHKREPLHFRDTVGNTNNIPLFSTVAFKKKITKKKGFWYNRKRNLDTVTSTLRTAVSFILFQDFNLLRW